MMKYNLIGWHRDAGKNIDKIWGVIPLRDSTPRDRRIYKIDLLLNPDHVDGDFVVFHGRRGKKLKAEIVLTTEPWEMKQEFLKKKQRGYQHVNPGEVGQVYPEFKEDLEKLKVWALLKLG